MTDYSMEEVREWIATAEAQAKLFAGMKGAHGPWTALAGMLTAYADLRERGEVNGAVLIPIALMHLAKQVNHLRNDHVKWDHFASECCDLLTSASPTEPVAQGEADSLIEALDRKHLCHASGTPEWPSNCECPKHAAAQPRAVPDGLKELADEVEACWICASIGEGEITLETINNWSGRLAMLAAPLPGKSPCIKGANGTCVADHSEDQQS